MVNKPSDFNIHRKVESMPKAINIQCFKNLKSGIVGAGSLNLRTCKNYWEMVTANFELKFLIKFLDIWKQIRKEDPSDLDKRKKILKITQVAKKTSIQKKKVKGKCACCLAQNFVL